MSKDETEGTSTLTENEENLSETNEENLDLFEDDPSQGEEGAHEEIDWEARAKKAEAKIVEDKKNGKTSPKEDTEALIEKTIAKREFFKENPEAKALEKEIEKYTSKGIELDKAYALVKMDHKGEDRSEKQARTNRATLANNATPAQSRITLSELEKLPSNEYSAMRSKIDKGEVTVV